jgi:pimeloyl-ACP methyl ester carboxylesterase
MTKILFLPGSGASPDYWKPVGALLAADWPKHYFGWPGLSGQPPDPAIKGMDDLVRLVESQIDGPVDLVAQSMGGIVAARIALARPEVVRRLILCVTSGGVDMARFGASDEWRIDYRKRFPESVWITEPAVAAELPVERIKAPTQLIWGADDRISPLAVGQHLEQRIAGSRLHVVPGAGHDVAQTHAAEVAAVIARHLT